MESLVVIHTSVWPSTLVFTIIGIHYTFSYIWISASWRLRRTRKKSCIEIMISSLAFSQLTKARKKVKDMPTLLAKFDEIYEKLHINGQVTACTLDTLLCHTPGDRKSHMVLLSKKTVSHRTVQPLSQSLWAE